MTYSLSIIVPMYNSEKTIIRCLNSIIKTFKEVEKEILIIDDGSKDTSFKMVEEKKKEDSRNEITIIKKENGGVSSARNLGIELSTKEYVIFLDSDDFINESYLNCIDFHILNKLDLTISDYNTLNSHGNLLKKKKLFFNNRILEGKHEISESIISSTSYLNYWNIPWNKVYNSKIIKENNLKFDETISLGEDFIFNLDYAKYCYRVGYFKDETYNYLISDNTLSKKVADNHLNVQMKIFSEYRLFFEEVGTYDKYENEVNSYIIKIINNVLSKQITNLNIRKNKLIINNLLDKEIVKCTLIKIEPKNYQDSMLLMLLKKKYRFILALIYFRKR